MNHKRMHSLVAVHVVCTLALVMTAVGADVSGSDQTAQLFGRKKRPVRNAQHNVLQVERTARNRAGQIEGEARKRARTIEDEARGRARRMDKELRGRRDAFDSEMKDRRERFDNEMMMKKLERAGKEDGVAGQFRRGMQQRKMRSAAPGRGQKMRGRIQEHCSDSEDENCGKKARRKVRNTRVKTGIRNRAKEHCGGAEDAENCRDNVRRRSQRLRSAASKIRNNEKLAHCKELESTEKRECIREAIRNAMTRIRNRSAHPSVDLDATIETEEVDDSEL